MTHLTQVTAAGQRWAVQYRAGRYPERAAFRPGDDEAVRGVAVAVTRAALLDHMGNEVTDAWGLLRSNVRRAIRIAVHQQLRGA